MFEDPKSRRAFLLFKLRTGLMLGGVSAAARRQLMEDLSAHLVDLVAHDNPATPEFERVSAAIARIGDPAEFLAPLIADAVLDQRASQRTGWRVVWYAMVRGGSRLAVALAIIAAIAVGGGLCLAAMGSFINPQRIGFFQLSDDLYQIRLLGLSSDGEAPVLYPYLSILALLVGGGMIAAALRRLRRLAHDILTSGL